MKQAKVSIIVPTYNSERFLRRAIDSIVNQTFRDWELIIVDDASTDGTKKIISDYCRKDKRMKAVFSEENSGSGARPINKGLEIAQGELIAFLESDDEWLPQKLEKQLEFLDDLNRESVVGCNFFEVTEGAGRVAIKKISEIYKDDEECLKIMYGSGNSATTFSIFLFRGDIFDKIGTIDEGAGTNYDNEFFLRICQNFNIRIIPEALVKYYIHGQNSSMQKISINRITALEYVLEKHESFFKKDLNIYSQLLQNIAVSYLFIGGIGRAKYFFIRAIRISPYRLNSYLKLIIVYVFGAKSPVILHIISHLKKVWR